MSIADADMMICDLNFYTLLFYILLELLKREVLANDITAPGTMGCELKAIAANFEQSDDFIHFMNFVILGYYNFFIRRTSVSTGPMPLSAIEPSFPILTSTLLGGKSSIAYRSVKKRKRWLAEPTKGRCKSRSDWR